MVELELRLAEEVASTRDQGGREVEMAVARAVSEARSAQARVEEAHAERLEKARGEVRRLEAELRASEERRVAEIDKVREEEGMDHGFVSLFDCQQDGSLFMSEP